MTTKRIAVLTLASSAQWVSTNHILEGLSQAWLKLDAKLFAKDQQTSAKEFVKQVYDYQPHMLVIIDHRLGAGQIGHLWNTFGSFQPDSWLIPLFGGHIPGNIPDWHLFQKSMLGSPIHFITASSRHKKFCAPFLEQPAALHTIPFAVSEAWWNTPLQETKNHILYAGRISQQKNVLLLAEFFLQNTAQLPTHSKLLLAGDFDDFSIKPGPAGFACHGRYSALFSHRIQKYPDSDALQWLGMLPSSQLATVMGEAACHVSLGLHHEEDFAMAHAQALSQGTPLILTDWAAHSDYQENCPHAVQLVPLHENNQQLTIDLTQTLKYLKEHLLNPITIPQRKLIREQAKTIYHPNAVAKNIQQLITKPAYEFSGFTSRLTQLALGAELLTNPHYYRRIYGPYWPAIPS